VGTNKIEIKIEETMAVPVERLNTSPPTSFAGGTSANPVINRHKRRKGIARRTWKISAPVLLESPSSTLVCELKIRWVKNLTQRRGTG
jgi:hypothetical protein